MERATDQQATLLEISRLHRKPIVSLLTDIQDYKTPQEDALGFLEELECLQVPEADAGDAVVNLRRENLNAFETPHYLALSYTWDASNYENYAWGREVTDDRWWRRGWTFQENYRAGTKMRLLISHPPDLEPLKKHYMALFGNVDGELSIGSVDFSTIATMFCMTMRSAAPSLYRLSRATIPEVQHDTESVLGAAGRYRIMLWPSELMTPHVLGDIEKKDISKRWDTLPSAANACQYKAFLSSSGTRTSGHLWKLSPKTIDTSRYPTGGAWVEDAHGVLELEKRRRLAYLAEELRRRKYPLSCEIQDYLKRDAEAGAEAGAGHRAGVSGFAESYLHLMADEVANAIGKRKKLRLGCLWDPRTRNGGSYMAVFVWDGEDDADDYADEDTRGFESPDGDRSTFYTGRPAFAFTASQPEGLGTTESNLKDLDRHVSFEVRVENLESDPNDGYPHPTPRLRIRRWLNGLCFFSGHRRAKVIFPWPEDLRMIGLY
ncbi:hypothetical protein MFIFM68171_09343 [Madurella fahalii]|uniref:Heterokaryon incompatibility domain-containing protein n=1 Tax=Madurella fahalii TaxID=1157608 RepID=A0ABQ0GMZ1_9PEZI